MVLGEAVLSAFLQVLFDRLASHELIDFFRRRDLDEFLLKKLRMNLLAVSAVLNDAEEKQVTNPLVKEWVVELKDTVYQAEDLLDLISTEALRCKAEPDSQSVTRQVWNYISTSFFQFDRNIESKIEGIIHRLEYIASQRDALGLKEVAGAKHSQSLPTTSLVDESLVYGRENDREEIVKLLLSDDANGNDVSIIAIIGMGGIGKTTLAQLAYNDCRVNENFDLRMWVCVSHQFDIIKVTKMILESVSALTLETEDLNHLQVSLKEQLAGKKFLIVLDDVWIENSNEWHVLKLPFKAGKQGSKTVVTTRNATVASIMRTVPNYHLKLLPFEDCWSLFANNAFGDQNHHEHPNLEVIGKAIVKKCEGLPLAAKALGGILSRKLRIEEWENVLWSQIWDAPSVYSDILPVLRLSYHYLPAHLKRCFVYCSIFPKGYIFEKEKLVLLWMAEGLLHHTRRQKTVEVVGNEYFDELLARSLFQQLDGSKTRFTMHGLVNDLAKSVAGEFCCQIEEDHRQQSIFQNARHLSYIQHKYDCFKRFEVFSGIKYLRSFLALNLSHDDVICYISDKVPNELLPALTYLRALSLSHYKITNFSDSIANLIYLRYLDLSHTAIRRLPETVTNLYNLQTLLLSYCYLIELPLDFCKLLNLRHLDIRGSKLSKMPLQMGKLKELQRLTNFVVGEEGGSRISELRQLTHLRGTLVISKLQHVVQAIDALQTNLKDKRHIDELTLEWDNNNNHLGNDMDVLDKLQPHICLKMLSIKGYGGEKFPNWMGDPSYSYLLFLTLSDCKNCRVLPPLGQLPLLEGLAIKGLSGIKRVGPEFYGACSSFKAFQSLKTLRFEEMIAWEDWLSAIDNESQGFPNLEELCLLKCPKLASSFPRLPSLHRLELEECDKMLLAGMSHFSSLASLKVITSLMTLPKGFFQQVTALKELIIAHSGELMSLSNQVGFDGLSMLETFKISYCQKLRALPPGLHNLTSIKKLLIDGCPRLVSFPERGLPPMLTHINIEECEALQSMPGAPLHYGSPSAGPSSYCSHLPSFGVNLPTTLKEFKIVNCKKLVLFPEVLVPDHTELECLNVFGCDSFKSLSMHFLNLVHLDISGCVNLESLPEGLHTLTSLKSLILMNCPLIQTFPTSGLPNSNLTSLEINYCDNLKSLPNEMYTIQSLRRLHISHCPQIVSFPDNGLPSNLNSLTIINCCMLVPKVEWELQKLSSLSHFKIARCCNLESFPDDWLLPSSLSSLHIVGMSELISLPKALQYLTSIENLEIEGCSKLLFLPEGGLPTSLSSLHISNCPILTNRCQKDMGLDWHKIACIPCITVNYKLIS